MNEVSFGINEESVKSLELMKKQSTKNVEKLAASGINWTTVAANCLQSITLLMNSVGTSNQQLLVEGTHFTFYIASLQTEYCVRAYLTWHDVCNRSERVACLAGKELEESCMQKSLGENLFNDGLTFIITVKSNRCLKWDKIKEKNIFQYFR